MKNLFLLTAGTAMLFTLAFCKNTPMPEGRKVVSDQLPEASAPLPMGNIDSVPGFQGCDKATWSPITVNSEKFVYQHFTVIVARNNDQLGEQITVQRDSGRADFVLPPVEAGHFYGVCRNKIFVESGTGTEGRQLIVFDVDKQVQFFNTLYYGEPQIVHSDRLYFLMPADEKEVTRIPDCPEKEQWTKDGLRVGYGQRCIFNLLQRTLTRKSEWVCVALQ